MEQVLYYIPLFPSYVLQSGVPVLKLRPNGVSVGRALPRITENRWQPIVFEIPTDGRLSKLRSPVRHSLY